MTIIFNFDNYLCRWQSSSILIIIIDWLDAMIAVVCRVHGARRALWISTSCFAALSKKGENHTLILKVIIINSLIIIVVVVTIKCHQILFLLGVLLRIRKNLWSFYHEQQYQHHHHGQSHQVLFLPGLLLRMAGTLSCLCLERGEFHMESDDGDHQWGELLSWRRLI